MNFTTEYAELLAYCKAQIRDHGPMIIFVDGWECVGKTTIIQRLRRDLPAFTYRPNYDFWADRLPTQQRWAIGASIVDFLSCAAVELREPILIDRSPMTGIVYMNDQQLYEGYSGQLLPRSYPPIRHLLVTTDEESFEQFARLRGDEELKYEDYEFYTKNFLRIYEGATFPTFHYVNTFDKSVAEVQGGK